MHFLSNEYKTDSITFIVQTGGKLCSVEIVSHFYALSMSINPVLVARLFSTRS